MSAPLVFTYNIRRTLFQNGFANMFKHIFKLKTQRKIYLLPIVNNLGDNLASRAQKISIQLNDLVNKQKINEVNLVSYSLSGLDARLSLSQFGIQKYVKSLTTIGTPHNGSKAAWIAEHEVLPDKVTQPVSRLLGVGLRPFWQVSTSNIKYFNKLTCNVKTKCFSIGGQRLPNNMSPTLRQLGNYLRLNTQSNLVYQNDGIIGHDECIWGQHLVNFQADHLQLVGLRPFDELSNVFQLIQDNILDCEMANQI